MKDLMQLSHRHAIEPKLYNSDALDKIHKLMGDGQMTKWISSIYDEDMKGEGSENDISLSLKKTLAFNNKK